MSANELFTTILILMGMATLRIGVPLLIIYLLRLALLKLVSTPG